MEEKILISSVLRNFNLKEIKTLLLQLKVQFFFIKLKTFNVWMEKELINGLE